MGGNRRQNAVKLHVVKADSRICGQGFGGIETCGFLHFSRSCITIAHYADGGKGNAHYECRTGKQGGKSEPSPHTPSALPHCHLPLLKALPSTIDIRHPVYVVHHGLQLFVGVVFGMFLHVKEQPLVFF